MLSTTTLLLLPPLLYTLHYLHRLHTNYTYAQRLRIPIIITPFDPYGVAWAIVSRVFEKQLWRWEWSRMLDPTWTWRDGDRWQRRYGGTFVLVSGGRNLICTSDEVAIEGVLRERREFIKPPWVYDALNLFGKNVDTVNGEEWARHRKLTAPCFNERVSGFVWDESLRQATAMLDHWLSQPKGKVSRMVDDTRIVALHVLYAAGFGISFDFLGGTRDPAPGHKLSHRDALMAILNNLITSIILAPNAVFFEKINGLLSTRLQHVLLALKEFRWYTDEAIASERQILSKGQGASKPNLISALIRTSDQAKAEGIHSAVRLTDDEIKGNIFIFNFAGHDTTANTLAYAFALLAVHPDIQNWVVEEIDEVLASVEAPKYEEVYPRLKRVSAVLYETLRLYGPVPQMPRGLLAPNTLLQISSPDPTSSVPTSLLIPPNTELSLKLHAMHTSPANFPNPKEWIPKRWIVTSSAAAPSSTLDSTHSTTSPASLAEETLVQMDRGFAPWSSGPRICPGMKFAQVEFAGVLCTVLSKARVEPSVKGDGDVGFEAASKKVMELVRDTDVTGPVPRIRRPEELWLKVSKR